MRRTGGATSGATTRRTVLLGIAAAGCGAPQRAGGPATPVTVPPHRPSAPGTRGPSAPRWEPLFDGATLGPWRPTSFGGEGTVSVRDGAIQLDEGEMLTGITWAGPPPPRMGYEMALRATRIAGDDFFCGLTFPVGDAHASLIVGGWHGPVVGISSLDGEDASENETKRLMSFARGRWYAIRLRVLPGRIQAFIDEQPVVDVATTGRTIDIRREVAPSRPLGIAAYRTRAALREIRLRRI